MDNCFSGNMLLFLQALPLANDCEDTIETSSQQGPALIQVTKELIKEMPQKSI